MEKTITELWVEQAKEKARWKIRRSSDQYEFTSENKFEYDFAFGFSNNNVIEDVIIFPRKAEMAYTFIIQNKKIIWENEANTAVYLPEDLKSYLDKYVTENTYSVKI